MDPDPVPTGSILRTRDKSASCCCAGAQVVSSSSPALTVFPPPTQVPALSARILLTAHRDQCQPDPPPSSLLLFLLSLPTTSCGVGLLTWWPTAPLSPRAHTPLFPTGGRIHQFLLLQISSHSQATVVTDCGRQDVAEGALCRFQAQPRSSLAASALILQLPCCTEALSCCCRKGGWRTQVPSL